MADSDDGNILDDLVAKAKEVGEQVKEFAEDAFDNVKEFASGAGDHVKDFTSDAVGKTKSAFDDLKDRFDGDDTAADHVDTAQEAAGDPVDRTGNAAADTEAVSGSADGPADDPSGDDYGSVHDAPVTDSVEVAADELAAAKHDSAGTGAPDDAGARGSSGEADPSDQPLPGDDSGDLKPGVGQLSDSGINDFGETGQTATSLGDTEASALDAPPEGPDAQTSQPLS